MSWQPIETCPENQAIDIWVKSTENPDFGRRACDMHFDGLGFFGLNAPSKAWGEYASHWMPVTKPPEKSE